MTLHFKNTGFGFEWGPLKLTRHCSEEKKGWVMLGIETPKHKGHDELQVYVTKTGKIRIHDKRGEWKPPEEK